MNKQCKLIIDTRNSVETTVSLFYEEKEVKKTVQTNHAHSQAVLPLIEKLLQDAKLSPSHIQNIEVLVDKGSYTGRRVGVAIATALGTLLSIPVNGKTASDPIKISYDTNKW